MKWSRRSLIELIASVLMIAVVLVLAILQYRWTDEISRSDQNRLKDVLNSSVRSFTEDFAYDFDRLCESFEVPPVQNPSEVGVPIVRQYSKWLSSNSPRSLVAGVYIWRLDSPVLMAISVDRSQNASWPARLQSLRGFLRSQAVDFQPAMPDRQAEDYPWIFFPDTPALIRPLFKVSSDESSLAMTATPIAFLVVELDGDFLKQSYLPGLVDRDFSRLGFDAAIRTASAPYQAIYLSTASFPLATSAPDAAFNLLDSVREVARRRGHPPVLPANEAQQWQLVAQHSSGSLDLAVGDWHRRNLIISFGLLAILAGCLVLVFSLARRAERFAELQMEFVAEISHELCTPLAVIHSAVENLADGVVDSPAQTEEYIGILRDQGGRLERLLNQVLQSASVRFSRSEFDLRPLDIAAIVSQSIAISEPMLRDAGFTLEREIQANLPFVNADAGAVQKCVENLISNAIKYGGANRWISVRAGLGRDPSRCEVQVSVEDKGLGIPAKDLRKVFDPFYRSQLVREGQFRGVGLGLFLVNGMMEAMGGSVTVSSELGRGTRFVLHFPVPASAERPQEVTA